MNIVSYCEGDHCYTTLHKMDLVSRGGIHHMSSASTYVMSWVYCTRVCMIQHHIQLHSERFYQDSIHSNSNDISSREGERSAHHIAFAVCWMLDDIMMYINLWWSYLWRCGDNMVSISSSKWWRDRETKLHIFTLQTWMISRLAREIVVTSLFTCWMIPTCYLVYLICHYRSHCAHIQTIPWDAERKHISNRSHDRCGW